MNEQVAYPIDVSDISLSTYFPKNTHYFYGYPAGEDSGFLNTVPPETEELVAMRAVSCAGPTVTVVSYAATNAPIISPKLLAELGIPELNKAQLDLLPLDISTSLKGAPRNEAIKQALKDLTASPDLVMAQPYLSQRLDSLYQIPAHLTTWLNDKQNLDEIFHSKMTPKYLASFKNGYELAQNNMDFELPVVIKVSSSSSGDGVYICKDTANLESAIQRLKNSDEPILVEQYVEAVKNYGLQFGIPFDKNKSIDFIGINEQLTSANGDFMGGIIYSKKIPAVLSKAKHYLEYIVLPEVRKRGWHGVGCFDILVDANNNCYFIDCNFRMTGMSAYHFLVANGDIEPPLLGFNGSFKGSLQDFESAILPVASVSNPNHFVKVIALSHHNGTWRFNAALLFKNSTELKQRCQQLKNTGISSDTFELLS